MTLPETAASRLIIALLLPDTDDFFRRARPGCTMALSPLRLQSDRAEPGAAASIHLSVTDAPAVHRIEIRNLDLPGELFESLSRHAADACGLSSVLLSMLLKRRMTVAADPAPRVPTAHTGDTDPSVRIDLSVVTTDGDAGCSITLPAPFMRHFIGLGAIDPDTLNDAVLAFFDEPMRLLPHLPGLVASLSDSALQSLLYRLMNRRLIGPYQLMVMTMALPDEAGRIRRNLSPRLVDEVRSLMRRYRGLERLTRRDLMAGAYSIEEAVLFLSRGGDDVGFAPFLRAVQAERSFLASLRIAGTRDVRDWFLEIAADGLLYAVLSACDEDTIARCIADDPAWYGGLIGQHVSRRSTESLLSRAGSIAPSPLERLSAHASLVTEYRRQRLRRRGLGAESLPFLLRRIGPGDFRHVLISAGWFVLSTALKGLRARYATDLVEGLPSGPRYLIEDVLRGVANPDILHDELQIDAARALCVASIARLVEEGIIRPAD